MPRTENEDEESMIRIIRSALIFGAVAAGMSAMALGQSAPPTEQTAAPSQAEQTPAAVIPPDQQPTKEQLAKLFEVMRLREQMQSMRQIVPSMIQQQVKSATSQTESSLPAGTKLTPEQHAAIENLMNKYVEKAVNIYTIDEMIDDMGGLYQRHLSRDDVDGMIAFYSSTPGQHLLEQQPLIAKEYMPVVMKRVTERSQVLTREMMKEMASITQPSKPASAKPAAK